MDASITSRGAFSGTNLAILVGSLHVGGRYSALAKSEAEGVVKLGASTIVSKMQQHRIFNSRL